MKRMGLLLLTLCAGCSAANPTPPPLPDNCQTAYVMLPGDYIIDLAAGARVELNPAFHSFLLFCSPRMAMDALKEENAPGMADWRVFELEMPFEELATPCGYQQWCLGKPAVVADWVAED